MDRSVKLQNTQRLHDDITINILVTIKCITKSTNTMYTLFTYIHVHVLLCQTYILLIYYYVRLAISKWFV